MRDRRFLLTAAASIMLLLFCVLASIACGSKSVGFPTVIQSLFHLKEDSFEINVVRLESQEQCLVFWQEHLLVCLVR